MRILIFIFTILYSVISMGDEQPPVTSATTTTTTTTTAATDTAKPQSVGQVIWTKGNVMANLPNQEKRSLARKADIYKEDTIESDKVSSAQISLTDGTLLAITENTIIQLEKYNYNKSAPKEDSYLMNVTKGGLRTITGEIGKNNPEETKTKTPIATLTTLGTDYSVIVKINNDTLISVKSGKVIATNAKGKTIELGKFDQRFAMINALNQDIAILKRMPAEFNTLNNTKFQNNSMDRSNPARSSEGGFCVGR